MERLESRILFHLEIVGTIPNTAVAPGTPQSTVELAPYLDNEDIDGTIVRFATDLGNIDMEMFDKGAPATVANFLGYVTRGDYNNTFFHRAVSNFIVQGGGYSASTIDNPVHIPTQAAIRNEFSPSRSNERGTVAMAKVTGEPDSATSEFFYNLANNNNSAAIADLDVQNQGFTVFGRVINNTMPVVDTIDGLPKANPPDVKFQNLPLQGSPPATADNVVKIGTATVVPETALFNYQLTSSDPELATPVVENGVLKLLYGAGRLGTATITITAVDVNSNTTVTTSFLAGVGELNVSVGTGGAKAATFTDADGTVGTIGLKGGSGTLRFSGSNLSEVLGKSGAQVMGNISDLAIDLTGTGTSGALTVKASGGDGLVTVRSFTADGGMKSIAGKQMNLIGNLTIPGNVAKADFANVTNSIMTFGGSGGGLALSLGDAQGVEIVSQIPIKTFKANSFSGGGPDVGTISAPAIGSLTVATDFNQRLDLAGSLGSAKIGGAVNSFLPWSVGGSAGKLSFGSIAEGFVADFLGPVASLAVAGAFSGDVSAVSVKSLAIKGDLTGANLILTGPGVSLGKATISGAIANSRIQATESIGTVTAATISASTIYAGVNTDGGLLPTDPTDFTSPTGSITSVTVKNKSGAPSFVNANIAASNVGKLSLGVVQTGNNGVPFGVAGNTIGALAATGTAAVKLAKLTESSQSQTDQDFQVRVF
jgi:cyclophilin family peptidyl-prolyl cis-trans isomerase